MSINGVPHMRQPCLRCPFRRDTDPGEFPACRYQALRETVGQAGAEAPMEAPWFQCHETSDARPRTCAGWLAVCGYDHIGVRLAVMRGRLPAAMLRPGARWPDLFTTYNEMVTAQAADTEREDQ